MRPILAVLAGLCGASAHLSPHSLEILPGSRAAGDTVHLQWRISIAHQVPHVLYFSADSGQTWTEIARLPEASLLMKADYVLPLNQSGAFQFRVHQSVSPEAAATEDAYTLYSPIYSPGQTLTPVRFADRESKSPRRLLLSEPAQENSEFLSILGRAGASAAGLYFRP